MKTLMCRESFDPTKIRNIPLTAKPDREYFHVCPLHLLSIIFPLVPCLAALGEG